jgi:type I restriction enzyme S subunit
MINMANKKRIPEIRFEGFEGAWEERKLGNLAGAYSGGGTPSTTNSDYWNGDIPWLQSSDIAEHDIIGVNLRKHITNMGLSNSAAKLIPANSIVIVTRVGVGKLSVVPFDFATSQDFLSISDLDVDIWFVAYVLYTKLQKELCAVQGTSIKGITKDELLNKVVSIPNLENEQTAIGNFFRNLDDMITLKKQQYEQTKNIKKAMLEKMFPKKGADAPEIRFDGFTGAWECKLLGEMMEITSVKRIHQSDWTDRGVRFIRARDIVAVSKGEEVTDILYISKDKYDEYSALSGKIKIGDLLVTGVGTIGVPMLIENDEPLYFKDGNVIWCRNNTLDGAFFYYSFCGKNIQNYIKNVAGVGTVGTYTIDSGRKTPIHYPDTLDEQAAIGNFFRNLDTLIEAQLEELKKLKNIKKACLSKMFV